MSDYRGENLKNRSLGWLALPVVVALAGCDSSFEISDQADLTNAKVGRLADGLADTHIMNGEEPERTKARRAFLTGALKNDNVNFGEKGYDLISKNANYSGVHVESEVIRGKDERLNHSIVSFKVEGVDIAMSFLIPGVPVLGPLHVARPPMLDSVSATQDGKPISLHLGIEEAFAEIFSNDPKRFDTHVAKVLTDMATKAQAETAARDKKVSDCEVSVKQQAGDFEPDPSKTDDENKQAAQTLNADIDQKLAACKG